MKMLSQYRLDSNTDNTVQHFQDSPRPCASPDPDIKTNNSTSESELQARMAHNELWLLESRIATLEQNFLPYSYSPYWTPYNYQAYHNPYPFYHNSSTQYYNPWACAGEHSLYTPNMHEAHYPYYCGSKTAYTSVNRHTVKQGSQSEYLFHTCQHTMSSSRYLTSDTEMAAHGVQAQPGPTLSINVDDIQAIAVHFSCRGRRKTTRIKSMHPPSSHARKTNKKKNFGIWERLECDYVLKYSNPGEKDKDVSRLCLTTSSAVDGEKNKEPGHHINSGESSFHGLGQKPKYQHMTGTGRASFKVPSDTNAERDKSKKAHQKEHRTPWLSQGYWSWIHQRILTRIPQTSLSIATLNVT